MSHDAGVFFNQFADQFDTFYDGKRSPWMQWVDQRFRSDMFIRYQMTFNFLGDLNEKTVLDIGCGSGPYIVQSLRLGARHVTGIDPAPRMLDLARQRAQKIGASEKLTLVEGYFPDNSLPGPYDYAIVMGVMDYIRTPDIFIKSMVPLLKIGAAVSFPSTHWFRTPFRKIRYKIRKCPVYFYTTTHIGRLMEDAGIRDYQIDKISGAGMDYVVCLKV